ncbi:MAG TPA: GAF domain-containing sensor histidine kinase [Gaiellaceae bacterium]|nr:GAF domain-containing sensor histidine kinase [Gaiellaceae bacterium]
MTSSKDLEATSPDRLRRLIETGIALSSELSLETLLRRLVETAVEITGAGYGALGVIDRLGTSLEQFITVGVDDGVKATIGDPPRGRGILGVLINERRSLRLRDLSQDPRSIGFPPGHPSMKSFLGVPITLRGTAFGALYLTEKGQGEEFTEADDELVRLLATQAAVAIENARLYEASRQWSRQLESLNEVSEALVTESELAPLLKLAAARLQELLDARSVIVLLPTPDGLELSVQTASGEGAAQLVGLRLDQGRSKAGRTLSRQRPERIDSLIDDPEVDQTAPRLVEATAALYVPLVTHSRPVGVVAVYDKRGPDPRFSDADMRVAQAFANRAAVALELSERVGRKAVQSLLEGQELERKRLARELHDETGQALASILLGLKSLEQQVGPEPVATIRELVGSALDDVRRLTVELRPPALDDFGLAPALERLTSVVGERSGFEIQLSVRTPVGLQGDQETAIYRIVQEALTNIVKHADASSVSIIVMSSGPTVRLVIEDDGTGFDPAGVREGALGLVGIRERVGLLGGRFEIDSKPGAGTTLLVELPVP